MTVFFFFFVENISKVPHEKVLEKLQKSIERKRVRCIKVSPGQENDQDFAGAVRHLKFELF